MRVDAPASLTVHGRTMEPPDTPPAGEPRWIAWAKELQSVAMNGLHYADTPYDTERYGQVLRVAAEMIAAQSGGADLRPVLDLLRHDTGYITPKVDVRGVVFRDGRMLLVRELADDGRWTLPGGWADPNDSPSQAVEREIREETGYEARAVRLLAVYDRSHPRHGHEPPMPVHCYKLFFLCELTGGTPLTSHETGESRFFAEDEIPDDISVSRVSRPQLAWFFRAVREEIPTADFD